MGLHICREDFVMLYLWTLVKLALSLKRAQLRNAAVDDYCCAIAALY